MEPHFNLSDNQFEQQFRDCQLDPALFSHEAHLRLAWIHLEKYGEAVAIDNICRQLLDYVDQLGAKAKYNKTLTVAAVKAVQHFRNKSESDNFYDFIREFSRLKTNFRQLMAAHYSTDIYTVPIAKQTYLEPDLLPFD